MTDRAKGLVVTLEHDMRVDDAVATLNAIRQIRGVTDVQFVASDIVNDHINRMQIRRELEKKLWAVLQEK